MSAEQDSILKVRGLRAQYGNTKVLHGIDFDVRKGGITTVLGANGAGKTTTLRAMCGMVATQGQVLLDGERIDGKATENIARMGVAHVPDGRGTFLNFTVEENLRIGAYTRKDRE
jgi:branched-chain amino acid transport system ATP-binding protein